MLVAPCILDRDLMRSQEACNNSRIIFGCGKLIHNLNIFPCLPGLAKLTCLLMI